MNKLAAATVLSAAFLAGCAGPPPSAAPTVTATATTTATPAKNTSPKATPTPTPTPQPVKTSGSYGADLAASGVVPDNVASYGDYVKKYMCTSDLTKTAGVGSFKYAVETLGKPGSESSGSGPAVVRLTIAYFCPERAAAGEKQLKSLGYIQ